MNKDVSNSLNQDQITFKYNLIYRSPVDYILIIM